MPSQYQDVSTQQGIDLTQFIQEAYVALLGHQKIVRGSCVPLRVSLSFVATKRRAFGVYFYQLF